MIRLYEVYQKRNRSCLVFVLFIFIVLLFRLQEIQIKLLPELTSLRYFIVTDFPNHSALDVDQTVSLPISNRVSSLKSVKKSEQVLFIVNLVFKLIYNLVPKFRNSKMVFTNYYLR